MFDKLVESRGSAARSGIRKTLLVASSLFVAALAAFGLISSLFNHTLAMGTEPGLLTRLLPPVAMADDPEPEPKMKRTAADSQTADEASPTRRDHIQRTNEVPASVPDKVSSLPSALEARPVGPYTISDRDTNPPPRGGTTRGSDSDEPFTWGTDQKSENSDRSDPKSASEMIPEPPKIRRATEHIGIVNSKAIYLDKPEYPAPARQMGVKGTVRVQVLIDTEGRVVSASVVDGPGMLRTVSLNAAKASRFSPTLLNTTPVSVRGIIIYNFK